MQQCKQEVYGDKQSVERKETFINPPLPPNKGSIFINFSLNLLLPITPPH